MKALGPDVVDLKQDEGNAFQGELKAVVGHLRDMVSWLKDNIGLIEKFGRMAIWLAGILATYAIAAKIMGIVAAVRALTIALAANPWALLATGVVAAGAIIYKDYSDMHETWERRTQEMQTNALRQDLVKGKVKIDDLRKRGMTDDQIRQLISGRNHLRLKHLPRTDVSGITLAFDIEYDHDLDGAMRFDAAKYPSVAWDAITFVCNDGRGLYD